MNYLSITDFNNKGAEEYSGAYMVESVKKECDLSEDYILPDYLPDAKKVLKFITNPIIEARFISSSGLDFSGSVYCRALYLGEDSSLRCASFFIPFEERIPSEALTEDCVDFLHPTVSSAVCRLQNPRKLSARLKLCVTLEAWQRSSTLPELYGPSGSENALQTLVNSVPSMNILCLREDDLSFSEDISLDKTMPDIESIILAQASVFFDDCHASKDQIICRGSLCFECIYRSPQGDNQFLRRFIPITEALGCVGADGECNVFAKCLCKVPDVSISEDEFGAKRIIELDLSYGVEISCTKEKSVLYAADAYSVRHTAQNTFSDLSFYSPAEKISSSFSVSEVVPAKDHSLSKEDSILACYLSLSSSAGKHGKLLFEGECKVSFIITKPDGNIKDLPLPLPLRFESDRPFDPLASYKSSVCCKVSSPRVRFDSEQLFFDFEVFISCDILSRCDLHAISCIRLFPESAPLQRSCEITLYYPSPTESIWDVAKKYNVTRKELASANAITSSDLPRVIKI